MCADYLKAALVSIEFDLQDGLAREFLQTQTDVRVRVVGSDGDDAATCVRRQFVPALQVFSRRFVEARPEQLRVATIRPEAVEEEREAIDLFRIRVQVINLHAVEAVRRLPTVEGFGMGDEDKLARTLGALNQILRR